MKKSEEDNLAELSINRGPIYFTAVLFALGAAYAARTLVMDTKASALFDLTAGVAAGVVMVGLAFYRIRKAVFALPLGMMKTWLDAHIYLGFVCLALVYLHSHFIAEGLFSALTLILFLSLIISGAVGGVIYKSAPVAYSKNPKALQPKEELVGEIKQKLLEADDLAQKTSEKFQSVYQTCFRPLMAKRPSFFSRFNQEEGAVAHNARMVFEPYKDLAPKEELYDFQALIGLYVEKERISLRLSQLRSMQWWLYVHVPLTAAALTAVAAHALSVWYF